MSRSLLILVLLTMSGTGCSATRPLLSTIVVTPPRLSFRHTPSGDSWHWTAVAVTYPSELLIPAPCAPSPVSPVELVTFFDEDECLAPITPSEPAPVATAVVPVLQISPTAPVELVSASAPIQQPSPAPVDHDPSSVLPTDALGSVALVGATTPTQPATSIVPVTSEITPVAHTNSTSKFPFSPIRVELPAPIEVGFTPASGVSPVSASISSANPHSQAVVASMEVLQDSAPHSLVSPAPVQIDLAELLTEIRQQRQLIEALQRDLMRERSIDNAEIEELEAAVENLLVQTKTVPQETSTPPK
jgi:hypothetical protein